MKASVRCQASSEAAWNSAWWRSKKLCGAPSNVTISCSTPAAASAASNAALCSAVMFASSPAWSARIGAVISLTRSTGPGWPLRSPEGGSRTHIFTVGFCFGGRNSWLSAAGGHDLSGAIGFYGMPGERNGQPGPIARAGEISAPILAFQAGADEHITAADNAAFDAALSEAGVEHEVVTFDGAPHSFFDRHHAEFQAASDDAWQRTLAFIDAHS